MNVDLHLLTMAFCHFRLVGGLKELRIVDQHEACERPQRCFVLEQRTAEEMIWPEDAKRPVRIVIDALALSTAQPQALLVKFSDWASPFAALSGFAQTRHHSLSPFRLLKRLHLHMGVDDALPSAEDVDNFCAILNSTLGCEDLSIQIFAEDWGIAAPATYRRMIRGICRCLHSSLPDLVDLDIQGLDIPVRDILAVLPHLEKLQTFHFHAEGLHSTNWREDTWWALGSETPTSWSVSEEQLETLTVECTKPISVEIAMCTLIECTRGKQYWDDMLQRFRNGENARDI